MDWLLEKSELNFFFGLGLSLILYIFLCIILILQDNSNSLGIFFNAVPNLLLVVVTFGYVVLTIKLVKTNQALFDAQSEPIVVAYLKFNDIEETSFIDLIIENVGLGTARNVKIKIVPSNLQTLYGNLQNHFLLNNCISVIGPKQRLVIRLCLVTGSTDSKRILHPNFPAFAIEINFQDSAGKEKGPESFDLDTQVYVDY